MSLTGIRLLLKDASSEKHAVGAFNAASIEMLSGGVKASKALSAQVFHRPRRERPGTVPAGLFRRGKETDAELSPTYGDKPPDDQSDRPFHGVERS